MPLKARVPHLRCAQMSEKMGDDKAKVVAIIVTYRARAQQFEKALRALLPQVSEVVVVDNTPSEFESEAVIVASICDSFRVTLLAQGRNTGIAAAQNIGLEATKTLGAEYVLFSDQDSLAQAGMVETLVTTANELRKSGVAVGCVCPAYYDTVTEQPFRFQVSEPGKWFYRSVDAATANPWREVITSISSGTLVPVSVLERVGGMREDFFIDNVDIEWCHRARAYGFRNFGTSRARLVHALGDHSMRVWWFGWRRDSVYSTLRLRYRFRNSIALLRLKHVPLAWCVRSGLYWIGTAYAQVLFSGRPLPSFVAILRGLRDGVLGRSGQIV